MNNQHRLIQTYLFDDTLEGIRTIDCESSVEAYIIPRLRLADAKGIQELDQPALYLLLNSDDKWVYIGESENFQTRAGQQLKSKDWWTLAVAVASKTNNLEKSGVKYLESLAVERVRGGSASVENSTIPPRNNIHRFKLHKLDKILDDTQLILTSLGYDIFSSLESKTEQLWCCKSKHTDARALFRGYQFVVLSGSLIDKSHTPSFEKGWPQQTIKRNELIVTKAVDRGEYVELTESVSFKSPNHAGHIVTGRSGDAWTT